MLKNKNLLPHLQIAFINCALPPETVIVGYHFYKFRYTNETDNAFAAVALVFAVDMNKPPGNFKSYTCGYIFYVVTYPYCFFCIFLCLLIWNLLFVFQILCCYLSLHFLKYCSSRLNTSINFPFVF
ncbi:hypothetical protein HanOQP8_Chr13g0483721 [Helianthus annuus]|nr:hypothetical protein HanOQP8_Chr13g0483721 [Helianthus annuus]